MPVRDAPEHWVGGLASPDLHAIVILFARDDAEHDRCVSEHEKLIASCPGVEVLSVLDLQGHSAIWLRTRTFRLSRQVVRASHRGERRRADAGNRRAFEAWRVHPWLPRRARRHSRQPTAGNSGEERQLHGLSAARRACGEVPRFPPASMVTPPEERELIAAKLMGRWRSGAPLVLAPEQDDPTLGADMQRTTTSPTRRWTRMAMRRRLAAHSEDKSSRHGAQHEPATEDSARCALRASSAGRRARRWCRARDRRFRHLREPHPAIRVCSERLDKRS